jgi:hypothetical protein
MERLNLWKLLFRAPDFSGDVRLDKVMEWFNVQDTDPLSLSCEKRGMLYPSPTVGRLKTERDELEILNRLPPVQYMHILRAFQANHRQSSQGVC